jgi:hypothetical protein
MEQSPPSEANSTSHSQGITRLLESTTGPYPEPD